MLNKPCQSGRILLLEAINSQDFSPYEKHCQHCQVCHEHELVSLCHDLIALPEIAPDDDFELRVMAAIGVKESKTDWLTYFENLIQFIQVPALALGVSLLLLHQVDVQHSYPERQMQYSQYFKQVIKTPISESLIQLQKIYKHGRKQG